MLFLTKQQSSSSGLLLSILGSTLLCLLFSQSYNVVHCQKVTTKTKNNEIVPVDRVYIAFANDTTTQMSVMFHTPTMPSSYVPMVKYSTKPNDSQNYTLVKGGESQTYHKSAGYSHHVVLHSLKPGTRYYYTAGNEEHGFFERENTFTTSPSTNKGSYSMIVYGDMGVHKSDHTISQVQKRLLSQLSTAHQYQMVFHVGDISYADVASIHEPVMDFEFVWSKWFDMVHTIGANAPYMVCPGNHEYDKVERCPAYSANFTVYNSVFRMPQFSMSNKPHNMWYSFDFGGVHFISISSETDYPNRPFPTQFGDQLKWFKKDLAEAHKNRHINPWIIVVGHRPVYSSHERFSKNSKPTNDAKAMQSAFEELFHEYQVDMYLAGHVHSYERTMPVYKSKVYPSTDNAQATVYIIAGAAGCVEGLTPGSAFYKTTFSAHIHYSDEGYGMLSTEFDDQPSKAHKLKWQYFRSKDDGLEDEVVLTRSAVGQL